MDFHMDCRFRRNAAVCLAVALWAVLPRDAGAVTVEWGSYLGGTGTDYGRGIAVDGEGNVYVTGDTTSTGWVSGGWDTSRGGAEDGFVVKLSASGAHVWSSYLGGASADCGHGVAVDGNGNVYASGWTQSSGWASGGWDTSLGGTTDGFVVKLSATGAHVWSTYLGGINDDYGRGIAVDGSGNVHATGFTNSGSWVSGGWDTSFGWLSDGFVVKLSATGGHAWSTYLGDASEDYGSGIAVDAAGNVYVTGDTTSGGWVSGGWDTLWSDGVSYESNSDGYLVKLTSAGAHAWSTFLGDTGWDYGWGVAVDGNGDVYATGDTTSDDWVSGGGDTERSARDGYLVKFTSAGAHTWSTYLGGTGEDLGYGVATDGSGNIFVAGSTKSAGWAAGGCDATLGGDKDGYVAMLSPAGVQAWSTYLGGSWNEEGYGIAVDSGGNVHAVGRTEFGGWVSGGWDTTQSGVADGYVVKLTGAGDAGDLQVAVTPPAAAAAGAQWRLLGETAWRNGGDTVTGVSAGQWSVEFKDVYGFVPPALQTVTVPANGTAQGTGAYTAVAVDMFWGSYLGGAGNEYTGGVAVDGDGNVLVAGTTGSSGWVSGGWDAVRNGYDGFVVKLSATGAHVWSTYLGGAGVEYGEGIAVDGDGSAYAVGFTDSAGWVSDGWDTTHNGGEDGFVVKLSATGAHVWSTYLGGGEYDRGAGVAVGGNGSVYTTGYTGSSGWVSGGWNITHGGGTDAYVVKLSASGAHAWSTYLGGTEYDSGEGVAVDGGGNVLAAGWTSSSGWVGGGWDTNYSGQNDGYVVKLSAAGAHEWSTYLGGSSEDRSYGVAVDGDGNVYATGDTLTSNWAGGGWDGSFGGGIDGYVVKLSAAGAHVWFTYLGGAGYDHGQGVSVDGDGNVFATGYTPSAGWVSGGWDTELNNGGGTPDMDDGYVVKLSAAGAHRWSAYLGGAGEDYGKGVCAGVDGNLYVTGHTQSPGWLSGGWDETYSAEDDGFLIRIKESLVPAAPSNPGATAVNADAITWTWQDNSDNESGFRAWSDPGVDAPSTLRTVTAANAVSWRQDGLPVNTQHAFQTAATNAHGDSAKTPVISAWTLALTPAAPVVGNPSGAALDVTLGAGDGNPAGTEYALRCETTGGWVQADGTLGAEAVWQTAEVWATVTVSGLAEYTEHAFAALARNGAGVETAAGPAASATTLDVTPPTGTIVINGGAAATSSPEVTLSLSWSDGAGSGVTRMRFSDNGATWTAWEPLAAARAFTLPGGDGVKTIRAQYRDRSNNPSAVFRDSISLDRVAPEAVISLAHPTPAPSPVLLYAVLFSEPVSPTFDAADVAVTGALAGTATVSGADPAYTVTVTLTGPQPEGVSGIQIGTGVLDLAGNPFAGAVSPDYEVVYWPGFASPPEDFRGYTGEAGPLLDAAPAPGGSRTPTYQWYWSDGRKTIHHGPTTSSWDLGALSPLLEGEYWCAVEYGGAHLETPPAAIGVRDRIRIVREPADQTAGFHGVATFSVTATGGYSPLHYQWKRNGEAVPDSLDAPVLLVQAIGGEDAGGYKVEIFDSNTDSTESATATLTVGDGLPAARAPGLLALAGLLGLAALTFAGRRRARRNRTGR